MSKRQNISLIRTGVDAGEAERIVNSIAGTDNAHSERQVFYPYGWFTVACTAPTLFGRKPLTATCLVDACNGIGATADPFLVDDIAVPAEAVLEVRMSDQRARKSAHRFLTHNLGRRLKTLGHFDVELTYHGVMHKAFWLVRCDNTLVMVDSVTGDLHKLMEQAA